MALHAVSLEWVSIFRIYGHRIGLRALYLGLDACCGINRRDAGTILILVGLVAVTAFPAVTRETSG